VNGNKVFDIPLPNPGSNGNGNGAPAAPTIADIDGDGQLEILIQTFDHGILIFLSLSFLSFSLSSIHTVTKSHQPKHHSHLLLC
jgi:hypothetical protein